MTNTVNIATEKTIASEQLADAVLVRHSTRTFSRKEIPESTISKLLESTRRAPSAKNREPWHFMTIYDDERKRDIAALMLSETAVLSEDDRLRIGVENSAKAIIQAPVIIIVVNRLCTGSIAKAHPADLLSIGAAIENLIISATAKSIQSLWVGDVLEAEEAIVSYLGIEGSLVSAVALGYSSDANEP